MNEIPNLLFSSSSSMKAFHVLWSIDIMVAVLHPDMFLGNVNFISEICSSPGRISIYRQPRPWGWMKYWMVVSFRYHIRRKLISFVDPQITVLLYYSICFYNTQKDCIVVNPFYVSAISNQVILLAGILLTISFNCHFDVLPDIIINCVAQTHNPLLTWMQNVFRHQAFIFDSSFTDVKRRDFQRRPRFHCDPE